MRWHIAAAVVAWMSAWPGTTTQADAISTKAGGIVRGELVTEAQELATAPEVTVRTLSGATVMLARDEVDRIIRRSPILEEYDVRRRAGADTAEAQWALALWCHQNSLFEERDQHLRRVIDFERSHPHARRLLGHYQAQGRWWRPSDSIAPSSFAYLSGSFALPGDWNAFQNGDLTAAERSWAAKVQSISSGLTSWRKETRHKALRSLRAIRDPDALPVLDRYLEGQSDEHARLIVLGVILRLPDDRIHATLVARSLHDDQRTVRETALGAVLQQGADRALGRYLEALRDPDRTIVNRAAYALGVIGDQNAVPALSAALATPEEYDEWTLGPDRLIKARRASNQENPEVLRALILLTGENFGYDKPAWLTWCAERNNLSVRN